MMMEMNTYIKQIGQKWYAFAYDADKNQVYSIGRDCPRDGTTWFARPTNEGIKYVARGSHSRNSAYQRARRNGNYCGVME